MSESDTVDLEEKWVDDDGSIKWGKVSAGVVGIVLSVIGYAYASAIGLVRDGVTAVIDGLGWFFAELIGAPFETGSEQFTRAAETAGDSLTILGPAAFPVAVGIAVTMMLILFWGVSRFA